MADDSPFSWLQSTPDTPPTPDTVDNGFSWLSSGTKKKADDDDPPPTPDAPKKKKKREKGDPIPLIKTDSDDDTPDKSSPDEFQAWMRKHPDDAVDLTKPPRPPTYLRSPLPTANDVLPPTDPTGVPQWKYQSPGQLQSTQFGPVSAVVTEAESGNKNIRQLVDGKPIGKASGLFQIEDPTWREFAPKLGVDVNRWPAAKDAPPQVQYAVASILPLKRWTAGFTAAHRAYPWVNGNITLGQADSIAQRSVPQRYIMAQDRDSTEWGRPPVMDYGPGNMPTTPQDVHPIMGLAGAVMRFLSSVVAIPTQLMLGSYTGYITSKQNGQLLDMMHHQGNWKDAVAEVKFRQEQELIDLASVQAAYQDNPQALVEGYQQIANKYGDGVLRDIADNPDAVNRLMTARDRFYQNISKVDAQQEKADYAKQEHQMHLDEIQEKFGYSQEEHQQHLDEAAERRDYSRQEHEQRMEEMKARAAAAAEKAAEKAKPQKNPYTTDDDDSGSSGSTSSDDENTDDKESAATPAQTHAPGTEPADTRVASTAAPQNRPAAGKPAPTITRGPPAPPTAQQPTAVARAAPTLPPQRPAPGTQLAAATPPVTDADREIVQDFGDPLDETPPPKKEKKNPWERLNPEGQRLARNYLIDPDALKNVQMTKDQPFREPIVNGAAWLENKIGDLAINAQRGKIKPDDIVGKLRNIDEDMGNTLQLMMDVKRVVPGSAFGGGGGSMSAFWTKMSALAALAKPADIEKGLPSWSPDNYQAMVKFKDPDGYVQRRLGRVATMAGAAARVLRDVNALTDADFSDTDALNRAWSAFWSKTLTPSSKFWNLMNNIYAFAQEDQAVRAGGNPTVTGTEEQVRAAMNVNGIPNSRQAVRDWIKENITTAHEAVLTEQNDWDQLRVSNFGVHDPMYGRNPRAEAAILAMEKINAETGSYEGYTPDNIPEMLRGSVPTLKPKKGITIAPVPQ